MAESQAERLKKELRFLKESYEAGIISEEEFKKGKIRIEGKLAEWGEGVVEEYGSEVVEPEEEEEEAKKEQSSFKPQKPEVSGKQEKLKSFEEEEKSKSKKKAVKKTEKPKRSIIKEKTTEYVMKGKKKLNIWKIATLVLVIIFIIFLFRNSDEPSNIKVDADIIVLNDKNCDGCDTTSAENVIRRLFPELTKDYLDYNTDQGKGLYNSLGIEYLPAYIFKDKLEETETWQSNENIKNSFEKKKEYYVLLASQTGSEWKP